MTKPADGDLEPHQADILGALRTLSLHLGWQGEAVVVEGDLVYQVPLPADPDISGALFVVERQQPMIRLYLTFPWDAPPAQRTEAAAFAVRCGYGRRFGALELDLDSGRLRIRVESDATEETLEPTVTRVLDRALALGRPVSRGWRAIAREGVRATHAMELCGDELDQVDARPLQPSGTR